MDNDLNQYQEIRELINLKFPKEEEIDEIQAKRNILYELLGQAKVTKQRKHEEQTLMKNRAYEIKQLLVTLYNKVMSLEITEEESRKYYNVLKKYRNVYFDELTIEDNKEVQEDIETIQYIIIELLFQEKETQFVKRRMYSTKS